MAEYAAAVEAGGRRRHRYERIAASCRLSRSLVPANPLESMARSTPDMIGIMFFSIVFGAALTLVSRESAAPVIALLDGVFKVVAKIIDIVMKVAPIGVACLLFTMTARFGFGFLVSLGWYVVTVLAGLAIHMFVVYPIALKFGGPRLARRVLQARRARSC